MSEKAGHLTLVIGPMFSGKSTELIRLAARYKTIGKRVVCIVHKIDDRYGKPGIATHDGSKWFENVVVAEALTGIDVAPYDVVLVEEAQFFNDAFEAIVSWVDGLAKEVVCAGLDGDFKREPFGDILRLIPHADQVIKLAALCKRCGDGTMAHFSRRVVGSDAKVLVGGAAAYEAVCRKHFTE